MNKAMLHIGKRLRAIRKAAGFKSSVSFCHQNNIPLSTYSQHETGKRTLTIEALLKYGFLFAVTPGWLLTGEGFPYRAEGYTLGKIQLLSKELGVEIENFKDSSEKLMPITKKEHTAWIDLDLWFKIFLETAPLFADKTLQLPHKDLLEFCIDIYNNMVTITADDKTRDSMISLSVSSLRRGSSSKRQEQQKTG